MFIYFPEFTYNWAKQFLYYSFNNKVKKEDCEDVIKNKLNTENIKNIIEDFKMNKISFPLIKLDYCFPQMKYENEFISNYNKIDNTITICKNYLESKEHLAELFDKEINYAIEINKKKNLNLNDYAVISIKACRMSMLNKNSIIENELVKRCAYLELKNKFTDNIKIHYEESELLDNIENLTLNEIIRKLINQNINK